MQSRIETIGPKILVGMSRTMSWANDETAALWKSFMPRRGEVQNRATNDYISMPVYSSGDPIAPTTLFDKYALVEVRSAESVPHKMLRYELSGGQYAVFQHIGPASDYPKSMQFIFGQWLPESDYELDQREQFEILPERYDPLDPEAEEELWIPIR